MVGIKNNNGIYKKIIICTINTDELAIYIILTRVCITITVHVANFELDTEYPMIFSTAGNSNGSFSDFLCDKYGLLATDR